MATTTQTTQRISATGVRPRDAAPAPITSEPVPRNPKDSMKSTWRRWDPSEWGHFHKAFNRFNMHPEDLDQETPVFQKTDKITRIPEWQTHVWVCGHALVPLMVNSAYIKFFGSNMHPIVAFGFYTAVFSLIGLRHLHLLRRLGQRYGFLDGDKHERDGVPDHSVAKVTFSLMATSGFRNLMTVILAYKREQTPFASTHWLLLPLEIGLYSIVLDFFFYWYHRAMHASENLWKYHRTHHLTKHPNPLLTLYADEEQEFFDIVGIPFLAFVTLRLMGLPMTFYEWYICHHYVMFTELSGHSGLRLYQSPPSTANWLLRMFNAELLIEDHDLHHRKGWKKSHNYGKQTRLWDRIFGTCIDRVESNPDNIDPVPGSLAWW